MTANGAFDKSRLPSRYTTVGPERAPHRAFLYAMGVTEEEVAQPLVGVAAAWNEAAPCNISLHRQAQAVKHGVAAARGTPREFATITVTDGIAMGHEGMKASLVSREIIADSVELTMRGHGYDALVTLAGCDKSLPGMMMAMCRLNVPAVFIYGGSILPGRYRGKDVTIVDVFEGVGQHAAGHCDDADLRELELVACPSAGSCGGQFTANTMACVSEAIGLALPGSAGAPAAFESRDQMCEKSGEAVMELLRLNLRPRDIVTRAALENAAAVVAATGGSTNAGLHLPAIANECGIDFDLYDVAEIFRKTPYIADMKPGGKYVAKDLYEVGGVQVVIKELLDAGYLRGDCITVTGKTLAENCAEVKFPEGQDVVYRVKEAIAPTGGVVGLKGNLAPEGAIVKVAGIAPEGQTFTGPAKCLRVRGGLFRLRHQGRRAGRRLPGDPLRGAEGRARHARDAVDHGGALRPRHRECRADHRRPLLRRHPRPVRRPYRAGGRSRRADRPAQGRRHGHHRRAERHDLGRSRRGRTGRTPQGLAAAGEHLPLGRDLALRTDRRPGPPRRRLPPRRPRRSACLCGFVGRRFPIFDEAGHLDFRPQKIPFVPPRTRAKRKSEGPEPQVQAVPGPLWSPALPPSRPGAAHFVVT